MKASASASALWLPAIRSASDVHSAAAARSDGSLSPTNSAKARAPVTPLSVTPRVASVRAWMPLAPS
jgi:hypothetical protein